MASDALLEEKPDRSISHYREILLLPLILHQGVEALQAEEEPEDIVEELKAKLTASGKWKHLPERLEHLGALDQDAYQEFLYFHGFIQDFLYDIRPVQEQKAARSTDPWAQNLYERKDLTQLKISLVPAGGPYEKQTLSCVLAVERMQLRLFASGVAIFMVELSMPPRQAVTINGNTCEDLNLDHLLSLSNALRRAYPPYFTCRRGLREYPTLRQWIGTTEYPADDHGADDYLGAFQRAPAIPLAPVWQQALEPLTLRGAPGEAGWSWHQILDDRMPTFLYLGAPGAMQFAEHDWQRICFVDEAGSGAPYSQSWLEGFEQRHCFDMHWMKPHYGTRYLFASHAFAAVGTTDANEPEDFFPTYVQHHFRRQYFQMGFLNYFQFAALLALSSWSSEAVKAFSVHGQTEIFRNVMRDFERRFLAFMQRCWFTNVSNQLQAREMYARWRKEIGTEELYQEVAKQLGDAWQVLDAEEQATQAEATMKLTVIATLAAAVGLPAAWLALFGDMFLQPFRTGRWWDGAAIALVTIGATALLALIVSYFTDGAAKPAKRSSSPQFRLLGRMLWALSAVGAVTALALLGEQAVAGRVAWGALAMTGLGVTGLMAAVYPREFDGEGHWLARTARCLRAKWWRWAVPASLAAGGAAWTLLGLCYS